MLYGEIIAACSEIHTKHINSAVWAERGAVECETWWRIKRPLGFKESFLQVRKLMKARYLQSYKNSYIRNVFNRIFSKTSMITAHILLRI